jgi:hypothetical protein
MGNIEFKFKDKRTTLVLTIKQVMKEHKPVLFVSHNKDDGTWQFFSRDNFKMKDAVVVTLFEMTEKDPTLNELFDLPKGWQASRESVADAWIRTMVK